MLSEECLAAVRKNLNDEILPRHLEYFENFLRQSHTGWLAGTEEPSVADFMLVPRLQWLASPGVHDGISSEILDAFPLLKGLIERFLDLPKIKAYYSVHHGK